MSDLSTKHRLKTKQFLALTAEIAISRYIVSIVTVKLIKEAFKKTIKIITAHAQPHMVIIVVKNCCNRYHNHQKIS